MSQFKVTLLLPKGPTVTLVTADRMLHDTHGVFFYNLTNPQSAVAFFPIASVLSAVEYVDDDVEPHAPKKAPELPTLSREHPVYTYGKGDLKVALQRCRTAVAEGKLPWNYLDDIIRDLHKGK